MYNPTAYVLNYSCPFGLPPLFSDVAGKTIIIISTKEALHHSSLHYLYVLISIACLRHEVA